jgi:seryl-tRNA synthetase
MESGSARKARESFVPELDRLEFAVQRLLQSHERLRRRAEAAEARVSELERAVQDVSTGRVNPVDLAEDARRLEEQNAELRARVDAAYHAVHRVMTRLQFIEEER